MTVTMEEAREVIEDVFDFDHVGDAMSAVRCNLESKEAQEHLVRELTRCAVEESDDCSSEGAEAFRSAAQSRVEQFVKGAKYSQSGCSKL
jgi:hypothetical protein